MSGDPLHLREGEKARWVAARLVMARETPRSRLQGRLGGRGRTNLYPPDLARHSHLVSLDWIRRWAAQHGAGAVR